MFTPSTEEKGFLDARLIDARMTPCQVLEFFFGTDATTNQRQLYIECRNLHSVNKDFRGILCAYKKADTFSKNQKWRMGILLDVHPSLTPTILVLEWRGQMTANAYPSFLELDRDRFSLGEWKVHFRQKIIWNLEQFKYLNLVSGYVPFERARRELLGKDGCLKMSTSHPDMMVLPSKHTLLVSKIPKKISCVYTTHTPVEWISHTNKTKTKRKRGRSARRRGGIPKWARDPVSLLDVTWDTHFLPHEKNDTEPKNDGLLAFPLLNLSDLSEIEFALIKKDVLDILFPYNGKLIIQELNLMVRAFATNVIKLKLINDPTEGVAFKCCSLEEWEAVESKRQSLSDCQLRKAPGILMSWFLRDSSLHPFRLTIHFVDLLGHTYKRGFDSRKRSLCLGMNLYHGERLSDMASATPGTPREDVSRSQYYRTHYKDLVRPFLSRKFDQMGRSALAFGLKGEPIYPLLSGPASATPCQVGLFTAGISKGTKPSRCVIGFANTEHADTSDDMSKDESLNRRITFLQDVVANGASSASHKQLEYITAFQTRYGLAVPTTCAYQWIRRPDVDVEDGYFGYFLLMSFGMAVRLIDGTGHQFFAHSFLHMTSLCLIVLGGKVHFVSPSGDYCLFAWGMGGKKKRG